MKTIISTLLLCYVLGFAQIARAQTSADSIDVFALSLEDLMNLKVTVATKSESSIDETPGIVTVIDRKMIETTGAKTLVDIIRMVPGFDFSRVSIGWGEPLDEFYARGIPSDFSQTILFLLNGRNKFNDLTYASPWMSQRINIEMIERIEIIRGPGSALYGGNAFSAVINIITRDTGQTPESFFSVKGSQFMGFSVYDLKKHRFKSGWMLGVQSKLFVERGTTYSSLSKDLWYDGHAIQQADKITDGVNPSYDISANVTSPNDKLRFQYWRTDHNPHPFMTGFYPVPNNGNYKYQVIQNMFNIEYKPSENLSISAHYSRMFWDWRTINAYDTLIRQRIEQYQKDDILGNQQNNDNAMVEANYNWVLGKHQVLAGASFNIERQFAPRTLYFDYSQDKEVLDPSEALSYQEFTRNQISAYLQDNFKVHPKVALTLGARFDHFQDLKNPSVVNPRAALVWNFYKSQRIKFLYGEAFRPPSGAELKGGSSLLVKSNPNIEPERIRTLEIAYISYLPFARLQISGYRNQTRKTILTDNNLQYQNLGNIRSLGLEMELQAKFWWVNYSLINSQLESSDAAGNLVKSDVNFLAFHHLNAGVNYTFFKKLSVSSQAFYRSPRNTPWGSKTKSHLEVDFKTRYTFKDYELSIGARNLLNYKFTFPMNDGGVYNYPYRGREIYITASMNF